MRHAILFLTGFALAANRLWGAGAPQGTLLELHSCELYAGGCVVSSQATLEGRYMLRVWNFTGGQYASQDLTGLSLALLESGSQNLAEQKSAAARAVIYLPAQATDAQRQALLSWAKSNVADLKYAAVKRRVVPLRFGNTAQGYSFSAGAFAAMETAPLESCQTGACGEALWYTPRSTTSVFTVAVNRSSRVSEPCLDLKWTDAGQRCVFLGRFGQDAASQNQFVTSSDFCSSAAKLF